MTYSVNDAQHLFTLLSEALWHTQHVELVMTQYNALMILKINEECGETIKEENVCNALKTNKPQQLDKLVAEAKERGILSRELEESFLLI